MSLFDFKRRVERLKDSVPLANLFERDGIRLVKNGSVLKCCCPFHKEKTPSLVIYPDGHYHCLHPTTDVLMDDFSYKQLMDVRVGDSLIGFDENSSAGKPRKSRLSLVEKLQYSNTDCLTIATDSSVFRCTPDHLWLTKYSTQHTSVWERAADLKVGSQIKAISKGKTWSIDDDYRRGYIMGVTEGDGTWRYDPTKGNSKWPQYWRVAMIDTEALVRLQEFLYRLGVWAPIRPFNSGNAGIPMSKVEVRNMRGLGILNDILNHRKGDSYARGYLAGIFDAEGTISGKDLIAATNQNHEILNDALRFARQLGFDGTIRKGTSCDIVSIHGWSTNKLRFMEATQPAILRKSQKILNRRLNWQEDFQTVLDIFPAGRQDIVEIQTSTRTFIANGAASHNCFGCNERGDIFSYVMRRNGCSFKEAYDRLSGGAANKQVAVRQNARQMAPAEPELPKEYFHDMWARWGRTTGLNEIRDFASKLGVLPETLTCLAMVRTDNSTWAFPMRDHLRRMIGIRLRDDNGKKFAVKGSKQGLFIPQSTPQATLFVTEGPTDCAALLSMGLYAVGKPAAMANPDEIVKFIIRWRVRRVVVIADNDRAGLSGAQKLVDVCPVPCCELVLPAKDAREFYRNGGTKEMIENLLKNSVWRTPNVQRI